MRMGREVNKFFLFVFNRKVTFLIIFFQNQLHRSLMSMKKKRKFSKRKKNIFASKTEDNYLNDTASINPVFDYQNISNPQTIYIKATNELTGCYTITTFDISVYNCPPFIPDGFSPNGDGINDELNIAKLYNIFTGFKLEVYNRWGNLVFESNQNYLPWNGRLFNRKKLVPVGIYYYILNLNDSNYTPIQGTVYVSR